MSNACLFIMPIYCFHPFFYSKFKLIRIKLKFLNKTLVSLMFYFYSSETDIKMFSFYRGNGENRY